MDKTKQVKKERRNENEEERGRREGK